MNDAFELQSVLTPDEETEMLRDTVVHFLSLHPLHALASFFGQALADTYENRTEEAGETE